MKMASHLSDIGFPVTEETIDEILKNVISSHEEDAVRVDSDRGPRLLVTVDGLIELWFSLENDTVWLDTLSLHYRTGTLLKVNGVQRQNSSGSLCSMYLPDFYPLIADVPDPGSVPSQDKDSLRKCQIACFAEDLAVYRDTEDFRKNSICGDSFSDRAFIPMGAVHPEEGARAIISGTVRAAQKRINSFTEKEYYIISAETCGGIYDILADPALLPRGISAGNVIFGTFWLSGKFTGPA